jgi:hypothetical protein
MSSGQLTPFTRGLILVASVIASAFFVAGAVVMLRSRYNPFDARIETDTGNDASGSAPPIDPKVAQYAYYARSSASLTKRFLAQLGWQS